MHKKILIASMNRADGHKFDEVGCLLELIEPYRNTHFIYGYYNSIRRRSTIYVADNEEYSDFLADHADRQLIFMHNHPNSSRLSYGDIYNLIVSEQLHAVTAVGNSGLVRFAYKSDGYNEGYMQDVLSNFDDSLNKIRDIGTRDKRKTEFVNKLELEQDKYGIIFKTSKSRG